MCSNLLALVQAALPPSFLAACLEIKFWRPSLSLACRRHTFHLQFLPLSQREREAEALSSHYKNCQMVPVPGRHSSIYHSVESTAPHKSIYLILGLPLLQSRVCGWSLTCFPAKVLQVVSLWDKENLNVKISTGTNVVMNTFNDSIQESWGWRGPLAWGWTMLHS